MKVKSTNTRMFLHNATGETSPFHSQVPSDSHQKGAFCIWLHSICTHTCLSGNDMLNYVLLEGHIHHLGIRNFTNLPTPSSHHLSFKWPRFTSNKLVQRNDSAFGDAPTHQTSCQGQTGRSISRLLQKLWKLKQQNCSKCKVLSFQQQIPA